MNASSPSDHFLAFRGDRSGNTCPVSWSILLYFVHAQLMQAFHLYTCPAYLWDSIPMEPPWKP